MLTREAFPAGDRHCLLCPHAHLKSEKPPNPDSAWDNRWRCPWSGADISTSVPPSSCQENLSPVRTSASAGDSPARPLALYPGREGARVRVGQQAWFWLGRKAGSYPASPVA